MPKIDALLMELVQAGGAELHLAADHAPLGRVLGELAPLRDRALEASDLEETLLELLTPQQRASLDERFELELVHSTAGARYHARYFVKAGGLGAVFGVIPSQVLALAALGHPEVLSRLAERRSGIVLVAGPARSGKSATLAALVDHVNRARACHILTIEDPIEHIHEPLRAQVTQREVGLHVPSFAAAVRSAARESADVVMISELQDDETAGLALELAGRGALVIAGVASIGAVATLERLVARVPETGRARLADTFAGVVSQQLVRTGAALALAQEILIGSPAANGMIREGRMTELASVMQAGSAVGMQTMSLALERLVLDGRITPEVALDRSVDRAQLAQSLAKLRPDLAARLI